MGISKLQEQERFRKLYWSASSYYDYPDGQDLLGKLLYTNKIAGLVGSILGVVAVSNFPPVPVSLNEKLLRYFQYVIPSLGMATAFTCVTYCATNIRKKDDHVNYIIGGLAAGTVLIPFTRNIEAGVIAAVLCAGVGAFKKVTKMDNNKLLPTPIRRYRSTYYDRLLDTSLEPDIRKGNWTK